MKLNKKKDFWKGKIRFLPILVIIFFFALGGGGEGIQMGSRELPGADLASEAAETAAMILAEDATSEGKDTSSEGMNAASEEEAAVTETKPGQIYVYVCGCVKKPGVYTLMDGARVEDAVQAAKGFTSEADSEYWNLAELLTDGEKVRIPSRKEVEEAGLTGSSAGIAGNGLIATAGNVIDASGGGSQTASTGGAGQGIDAQGRVNINLADQDQLMTLNGIGEVKSASIIAYREEHGAFLSIDEIKNVSGIGKMTYENIKDSITVG